MSIKQNVMNSKIRVEHDFDTNESFIQLTLESGDNSDKTLKNFVNQVSDRGIELIWTKNNDDDTIIAQLRPKAI